MQNPWLARLLQTVITIFLIGLALHWLGKIHLMRWLRNERGILRHEPWVLILGLSSNILFFGLAILSNTWLKNNTTTIWSTMIFVGFGSLGIPFIADYFFARHRVNEKGIDYGSMLGFRGRMDWSEVERISFSPNMGWLVLHSQSGRRARVSILLSGLKEFARLVLDHVPRERIDREVCLMLMQAEHAGTGVFVDPDSEEWRQALIKARKSIPTLMVLHRSTDEPVLVKYAIPSTNGELEHVWGELEQIDATRFRATLETPLIGGDPVSEPPFELPIAAMEDWVVNLPDGSIRGGFTTQVEIQTAKLRGLPLPDHIAAMDGRFCDR